MGGGIGIFLEKPLYGMTLESIEVAIWFDLSMQFMRAIAVAMPTRNGYPEIWNPSLKIDRLVFPFPAAEIKKRRPSRLETRAELNAGIGRRNCRHGTSCNEVRFGSPRLQRRLP